jgi:sodium/bile acid cotransporter 7
MRQAIERHWFLGSLVIVLCVGMVFSQQLTDVAQSSLLRSAILVCVLFLMSLPMETRVMWRALTRPWPALLASFVNMGVVPVIAWGFSRFLPGDMSIGLIIASVVPCTMASAAVWTHRAGGNDASAILVTLLTNVTCWITTPAWLFLLLGREIRMDARRTKEMAWELALLVVLPIVAGQALRYSREVAAWATRRRRIMSNCAQVGILGMVLIGAIQTGLRLHATDWDETFSTLGFVMMGLSVLAVHIVALWLGKQAAAKLGMRGEDQIAVAIAGSQKTLMVGVYIAVDYFGGLTILPMVAYHVGQLVVDTMIVDRWRRQRERTDHVAIRNPG